uniref:Septum site-determining protein MinC n=1 Tax=Vannella robusta TaxID=1487602 RepID=A0A7S4IIB7_9EUKA|mmetsp:Transcript_2903/g.3576  ORF Transcript_2903/g.3576 Transcript_2903/m.3576 type:complete len:269 (+) Transcript_2903:37-843(+)
MMYGRLRSLRSFCCWEVTKRSANILVSKSFNLPTVRLGTGGMEKQIHELGKKISLAPGFYKNAPVVIDAEEISAHLTMEQIKQIYQNLVELHLQPIGVTNLSQTLQKEAQDSGIPIITVPKGQTRTIKEFSTPKKEQDTMKENAQTPESPIVLGERKEILSTVRSGQQVYARGPKAQLIILGNVSSGAEVLSDGDIHIHGSLFGRALAGISGDEESRIYTKSMQAELVAIGGLFTSGDSLPDPVEASTLPCMVFVSEKKLSFALASAF